MPAVFRAVVASLAGRWRPSRSAGAWPRFFFLLRVFKNGSRSRRAIPGVGTGPRAEPR